MEHAKIFSASSFERLMLCPGSAVLAAGAPRTSSQYSAEGTLIHEVAAQCLTTGRWPDFGAEIAADGFSFTWDADMESCAQQYVDYVRGLDGDALWVETRVQFGAAIGVDDPEDGFGTADAIVAKGAELIVVDLKTGRGVSVEAEDNPQLKLYATGALELLQGLAGDFETVRLVIVQPRAGGVKEWTISVEQLMRWAYTDAAQAASAVRAAFTAEPGHRGFLTATEKGCRFCPAKATCPALRDEVTEQLHFVPASPDEFAEKFDPVVPAALSDTHWLAACLSKVDMIEDWCKAVRAEAERRLMAGESVPGFKVVAGKRGARTWADPAEVEKLFKETFRLKTEEAYDLKLISPTTAEKLHKQGVIGPRQWSKVTSLITQSEGKPHVAPESDPRPALDVSANQFDNLTA